MAEREYTTKGQGNLNTVLGAVGTAAAVMPNLFNGGIFAMAVIAVALKTPL